MSKKRKRENPYDGMSVELLRKKLKELKEEEEKIKNAYWEFKNMDAYDYLPEIENGSIDLPDETTARILHKIW